MNTKRTAWTVAILAAVILALAPAGAKERITLRVSPETAMAPADVRIEVLVPRDPSNRTVRVVADSGAFYSSSDHQLDGGKAAALHDFTIAALPAGTYEVSATVLDGDGRVLSKAADRVIIMSPGGH